MQKELGKLDFEGIVNVVPVILTESFPPPKVTYAVKDVSSAESKAVPLNLDPKEERKKKSRKKDSK